MREKLRRVGLRSIDDLLHQIVQGYLLARRFTGRIARAVLTLATDAGTAPNDLVSGQVDDLDAGLDADPALKHRRAHVFHSLEVHRDVRVARQLRHDDGIGVCLCSQLHAQIPPHRLEQLVRE